MTVPYLPDAAALETVLPRVNAKDMQFQIRMIEEQYQRMYPVVSYYSLKKSVTQTFVTPNGDRAPVGQAGTTKYDPVWNESVDPALAAAWVQPHSTPGTVTATATEQFASPIQINARIQRITKETQLKKYGFDKIRDLTLFIPLSLLDRRAITVLHHDKFLWNSFEYQVLDLNKNGYWKNTDVALYMVLNCEQLRKGG